MKQKLIASLLIFVLLWIVFSNPSKVSYANTENNCIPLSPQNWVKTGEKSILSWQNNVMVWEPKENNACITCSTIPGNWKQYSELKITYKTNQPTSNWITVLLYDQFQNMRFTYFTVSLEKDTINEQSFPLHTLFSAFGGDSSFRWDKMKSISICTHPTANQEVGTLALKFSDISLLKDLSTQPEPFLFHPPYPIKQNTPILFSPSTVSTVRTYLPESSRLQTILSPCFNQKEETPKSSTEILRNIALQKTFSQTNSLINCIELLFSITPSYWDDIYQKNDIFIQEQAIQYLIAIDLLKENIQENNKVNSLVQKNLHKICSIEYDTCRYWIAHYPYGKGNNHVTRAASILGLTSLFIHDADVQEAMLQFSLLVLNYYFEFQIGQDGVMNEGTHYYTYLMEIFTYFAYGMKNTYGLNLFKDFPFSSKLTSMIHWAMLIQKPSGYLPSIDDSWQTRVVFPFRFYIPFYPECVSELLWRSTCFQNQKPISNESWNITKSLYIPLSFLSFPFELNNQPIKPVTKSTLFKSDSQIIYQGFSNSYIAFTGKKMSSLHEQNDCGNIYLEYQNKPILLESGYGPLGWTSLNRPYYVSSHAHNVALIDGVGPQSWYNGGVGPIDTSSCNHVYFQPTFLFASLHINTDITNPDVQSERILIHSNPDSKSQIPPYYLILDSFHSKNIHTYSSTYHPNGNYIDTTSNSLLFQFTTNTAATNKIIQLKPTSNTYSSQHFGWFSAYWDQEEKKAYYSFSKKEKSTVIGTLLTITTPDYLLNLTESSSTKGIEYIIEQNDNNIDDSWLYDLIMINDAKIMAKGKKILTNGTYSFARVTNSASNPSQYYTVDANYLNINNEPVFYSNHSINFLHYIQQDLENKPFYAEAEVSFQNEDNKINFFFDADIQIQKIMLDNNEIEFLRKNKKITINIPSGKHFLTFE